MLLKKLIFMISLITNINAMIHKRQFKKRRMQKKAQAIQETEKEKEHFDKKIKSTVRSFKKNGNVKIDNVQENDTVDCTISKNNSNEMNSEIKLDNDDIVKPINKEIIEKINDDTVKHEKKFCEDPVELVNENNVKTFENMTSNTLEKANHISKQPLNITNEESSKIQNCSEKKSKSLSVVMVVSAIFVGTISILIMVLYLYFYVIIK